MSSSPELTLKAMVKMMKYMMQSNSQAPCFTSTQLVECSALLTAYDIEEEDFHVGDIRVWELQVLECLEDHSTLTNPDYTPDNYPDFWKWHHTTNPEKALLWKEPTGENNSYSIGDIVLYGEDKKYRSLIDNNMDEPSDNDSWEEI